MSKMPFRYSSGASSSSLPRYPSTASRMRSSDSPDQRSVSESTLSGTREPSMAGEVKVITALVGRIVNKLPCNSGMRLASMEVDVGVAKSVDSLLRLAALRLGAVVQALVSALETLSKFSNAVSLEDTGLPTLHSQIYLLHLLNECLSASWRLQSSLHTTLPSALPQLWPDPVPLDETTARYLLLTTLNYIRMVSTDPVAGSRTSSPAPGRDRRNTVSSEASVGKRRARTPASNPVTLDYLARHSYTNTQRQPNPAVTNISLSDRSATIDAAATLISQLSAQIIFFLSASNWSMIRARLHSRVAYLTTTIEEMSELLEMKVLEWSNINSARLSQALFEISTVFLHVKKFAQIKIAVSLRKAIWQWMTGYPAEFQAMIDSDRTMDGGPDTLFDFLWSASELGSVSAMARTRAFYPLMAMLLVLCPDLLKKAVLGESGRPPLILSKKIAYLDSLRKGLESSKSKDLCAACYIDLIRASSLLDPRGENFGVRNLISDVETDVKNVLFFSPFLDELTDVELKVDGLVALHRRTLGGTLTDSWNRLWTNSRENSKVIALKACVVIADDGNRLPWYAPLEQLRVQMEPYITSVFRKNVVSVLKDSSNTRGSRTSLNADLTSMDVVSAVLELYAQDPRFALPQPGRTEGAAELLNLMGRLSSPPTSKSVRELAVRASISILDLLTTERLGLDKGAGSAIWKLLLESSRPGVYAFEAGAWAELETACDAFRSIVASVHRFALVCPDVLADDSAAEPSIVMALELLLKSLTLMDIESRGILLPSFAQFAELVAIAYRTASKLGDAASEDAQARVSWIRGIADVGDSIGKVQQQRAVRRVMAIAARATTSGTSSWLFAALAARQIIAKHLVVVKAASDNRAETRRRQTGLATDVEGMSEDEAKRWKQLFLLVCACLNAVDYEGAPPPSMAQVVGVNALPAAYATVTDPKASAVTWLKEAIDLLASDSVFVRETAKEGLGGEIPIAWGSTLIRHLSGALSLAITMSALSPSGSIATLADQIIMILRLFVDRIPTGLSDSAPGLALDELLLKLGQTIKAVENDEQALRMKTRFCGLCEIVMRKAETVQLGADEGILARNQLVEWIVSWQEQAGRDETQSKLSLDLELACLKAMDLLTDGLELHNVQQPVDEAPETTSNRLFVRHSSALIGIISLDRQTNESSNKQSATASDDRARLATSVMTNLLAANLSTGLKHSLSLGYSEDSALRTAFIRMMTNVLRSGAELDRTRGSRAPPIQTSPYFRLLQPAHLALAVAIVESCPPGEVDEVSQMLFRVTEGNGALLPLMRVLIEREVALTNHESELFRANSITTRILTIFARSYGHNYLKSTLAPFLQALAERPSDCSFELDPSKTGPDDDIHRNAEDLTLMCQALLDLICSSIFQVPVLFRAICHHIWETVGSRFPDSRHSSVGSFIFLRFICPAIVSPENADLELAIDSKENRRGLLLLTKIIQNLANNVVFGNKEPHMKILNGFLTENIRAVTKFLGDVALKPRSADVAAAIKRNQEGASILSEGDADGALLHRFVYKHQTRLESSLRRMPVGFGLLDATNSSTSVDLDGKATLRELQDVMEITGPLPEVPKLSAAARLQVYTELMKQHGGKSMDAVQQGFYEGPASQNGRRLFYLILTQEALVEPDVFACHIFSTVERVKDPFDLVIDLSEFSSASEPRLGWLKKIIQILPGNVPQQLQTTVLYNPNTYARRRVRRILAELSDYASPMGRNLTAVCGPAELAAVIPFTRLALPESTLALAYEADKTFDQLDRLFEREQQARCIARLGHDRLQVATWYQQEIAPALKSYVVDVISLQDIEDIVVEAADRLTIKHAKDQVLTLISRDRAAMAQALRTTKSRLPASGNEDRRLRSSDVPGTLLYIALLNLSSIDTSIRSAAYQLLDQVRQTLKCDMSADLLPVSGFVHLGSTASIAMVAEISSAFARALPELTLVFLKEWIIGFNRVTVTQKTASLFFISPWVSNIKQYATPNDKGIDQVRELRGLIRGLITLTASEQTGLAASILEHVWAPLRGAGAALGEIIHYELIITAIDAGPESDKTEIVGGIMYAIAGTACRGRVITRLRKTLAQSYLKPSNSLSENAAWSDILVLARLTLILCHRPDAIIDIQLFLPELIHIVTLILGPHAVAMRRIAHGILVNIVQSHSSAPATGDTDVLGLHGLLEQLSAPKVMALFGLKTPNSGNQLAALLGGPQHKLLDDAEGVARLGLEIIEAAAPTMDCANAWRARWMGLVAATCFQHNPATQPQAFSVLGTLMAEEIDYDLIYQILVALSSALSQFSESSQVMTLSIVRCLARVIPGLLPESRYTSSLFWLAVSLCQMGFLPIFPAAMDLMLQSLKAIRTTALPGQDIWEALLEARRSAGEAVTKLDATTGVSFETSPCFSLVAIIFRGTRHATTRKSTIDVLQELLRISVAPQVIVDGEIQRSAEISEKGTPFFVALLGAFGGAEADMKDVWACVGHQNGAEDGSVIEALSIPDNSTALLLVTMVASMLNSAGDDAERLILYRFLVDAGAEMPEVLAMSYDALIPRMIATLSTTSHAGVLESITTILERAMLDSTYTFPAQLSNSESQASVAHSHSYSQSLAQAHSLSGTGYEPSLGSGSVKTTGGQRDQVLEEMGMKGLTEMSWSVPKMDKVAELASWVAVSIDSFTI